MDRNLNFGQKRITGINTRPNPVPGISLPVYDVEVPVKQERNFVIFEYEPITAILMKKFQRELSVDMVIDKPSQNIQITLLSSFTFFYPIQVRAHRDSCLLCDYFEFISQ